MDIIKARAKINLFLHVINKTGTKHDLQSLVVFAEDIYDKLYITPIAQRECIVSFENIKLDSINNSICKTWHVLSQHFQLTYGYEVKVKKNIPMGAGLGGGSSDAAVFAKKILTDNNIQCNEMHLENILLEIGADVPVCFKQKCGFFDGVGSITKDVAIPELYTCIVKPPISLSTAGVFAQGFANYSEKIQDLPIRFTTKQLVEFLSNTKNDLLPNSLKLYSDLQNIIDEIAKCKNVMYSNMSGSGSTCFGLFDSLESTEISAKQLKTIFKDTTIMTSRVI